MTDSDVAVNSSIGSGSRFADGATATVNSLQVGEIAMR